MLTRREARKYGVTPVKKRGSPKEWREKISSLEKDEAKTAKKDNIEFKTKGKIADHIKTIKYKRQFSSIK